MKKIFLIIIALTAMIVVSTPSTPLDHPIHIIDGFEDPYGVDVIDGMLYISDGGNHTITRFTEDGERTNWTHQPSLQFPHAILKLDDGTLLVADYNAKTILKLTDDGEVLGEFYDPDSPDLALKGPPNVDRDDNGNIWVADYAGHRILKFDQAGNLLGWKGEHLDGSIVTNFAVQGAAQQSNALGGFDHPHHIAIDHDGTFYVTDMDNHRIQKFARDGTVVGWLGANADGSIANGWATSGTSAASAAVGGFNRPLSIQVTPDNMLLVSDSLNHRLQRFTMAGEFAGWMGAKSDTEVTDRWEMTGTAVSSTLPGGFDRAINAVQHNGKIYAADSNGRIQIFTLKNTEE